MYEEVFLLAFPHEMSMGSSLHKCVLISADYYQARGQGCCQDFLCSPKLEEVSNQPSVSPGDLLVILSADGEHPSSKQELLASLWV